ncbi:MAG: hypothetical protein ACK4ZH_16480 [Dolichospermum sp.]|jgi:hypothetical protein
MVYQQLMTNFNVAKVNREDDTFGFIQARPRLSYRISSFLTNHTGDDDDPIVPPS